MYIRAAAPPGAQLATLPIYFYLFPALLVNAALQPCKMEEGVAGWRGRVQRDAPLRG